MADAGAIASVSPIAAAGRQTLADTVVFIHGLGNKPEESVLKCQWDTALFGVPMGERTRMAYWVNRDYYPAPEDATCANADRPAPEFEAPTVRARALPTPQEFIRAEIEALTADPAQQALLNAIADKMMLAAPPPDARARILPLPASLRMPLTAFVTRLFLRDANDFLFRPERREQMRQALRDRIGAGSGPFIVIAHSQGTMIAYDVLRQLQKSDCDVKLFVTLGSPLGLSEVQDVFRQWTGADGQLPFPPCVDRWVNVADHLDIVAIDPDLTEAFAGSLENFDRDGINLDSPRHPHSGTGYLRSAEVRRVVAQVVGPAFAQALAPAEPV